MATTSAQRVRAHRASRRRREVQLTIEVSEGDLLEIARAGYGGRPRTGRPRRKRSWSLSATSASSSRPKRQAVAVQQAVAAQRLRRNVTCDDVTKHRQPRAPEPPPSLACPVRSLRPAPAA
jgi:hypothetical protein